MKITTFMIAAVATIAGGMGTARASDGWDFQNTLNANSKAVAPYTTQLAQRQAQQSGPTRIAAASRQATGFMTYGNG